MAEDTGRGGPGESTRPAAGAWDPWPVYMHPRAGSRRPRADSRRPAGGAHRPSGVYPGAPPPGIIPLRPLGVGEILSGALAAARRNPGATLGISAVVTFCYGICVFLLAPHTIPSPAAFGVVLSTSSANTVPQFHVGLAGYGGPAAVAAIVLFGALYLLLDGMLTAVIWRLVLGMRMSAGQAVRAAWRRLPAMIGAIAVPGLLLAALWDGYAVAGFSLHGLPARGPMVFFLVLAGVPLVVATSWLVVSCAVALPAVVLEHAGPLAALRRSCQLVRGSWWRVFGIGLLTAIIMSLVSGLLRAPFGALAVALTKNAVQPPAAAVIVSTAGRVLADTITTTLAVGVVVLLYVDLRMRREGLDRSLRAAAGGQLAAAGQSAERVEHGAV
jgi:hypothetical protein